MNGAELASASSVRSATGRWRRTPHHPRQETKTRDGRGFQGLFGIEWELPKRCNGAGRGLEPSYADVAIAMFHGWLDFTYPYLYPYTASHRMRLSCVLLGQSYPWRPSMSYTPKPCIDADAVLGRVQAEGPLALLTRGEAAALVAARTMRVHDSQDTARNRVAMQLDRAAQLGNAGVDVFSGGISRLPDGRMTADELRRWGAGKYGPIFDDFPRCLPREVPTRCDETFNVGGEVPDVFLVPGDPARKDEMIHRLHAALKDLEAAAIAAAVERKRNLAERLNKKH